jgi:pectinesterase
LGRAWRPTTTFSDGRYGNPSAVGAAAFIDCWLGDHIASEGWDAMEYGARDGSRVSLQPEDARFVSYRNRGPGVPRQDRGRLLSKQQAKRYTIENVLGAWRT